MHLGFVHRRCHKSILNRPLMPGSVAPCHLPSGLIRSFHLPSRQQEVRSAHPPRNAMFIPMKAMSTGSFVLRNQQSPSLPPVCLVDAHRSVPRVPTVQTADIPCPSSPFSWQPTPVRQKWWIRGARLSAPCVVAEWPQRRKHNGRRCSTLSPSHHVVVGAAARPGRPCRFLAQCTRMDR